MKLRDYAVVAAALASLVTSAFLWFGVDGPAAAKADSRQKTAEG